MLISGQPTAQAREYKGERKGRQTLRSAPGDRDEAAPELQLFGYPTHPVHSCAAGEPSVESAAAPGSANCTAFFHAAGGFLQCRELHSILPEHPGERRDG